MKQITQIFLGGESPTLNDLNYSLRNTCCISLKKTSTMTDASKVQAPIINIQ